MNVCNHIRCYNLFLAQIIIIMTYQVYTMYLVYLIYLYTMIIFINHLKLKKHNYLWCK